MRATHLRFVLFALLASTLVLTACAKRPVLGQASVPAPTGVTSGVQPASPTVIVGQRQSEGTFATAPPPAPASPQGVPSAPQLSEAAPPRSAQPGAAARPEGSDQPSAMPAPAAAAPAPLAAAPPPPKDFAEVAALQNIHFDFDRYEIRPGDRVVLNRNAEWLKSNPQTLLLIEGHCDERGTNQYNLALGDRRAKSAQAYLVAQGIQSNRISIISYGEERPACTEKTEDCWAKNRRAHFLVKPQ